MLTSKTRRTTIETTMLLTAAAIALSAVACERTKSDSTETNTPPSATPPTTTPASSATITGANVQQDPLANVENRARVKEVSDEAKLEPPRQAQLLGGFAIQVREAPAGQTITTVKITEPVRELARSQSGDYYLVTLADPKDSSKELGGWIYRDAVENNAWASETSPTGASAMGNTQQNAQHLKCSKGETRVQTSMELCAKICKDDGDCDKSAGQVCDGLARAIQDGDGKPSNVSYCISGAPSKTTKSQ